MSYHYVFQNSISDLKRTLNNNDVMFYIVQQLMSSLNSTPIVEPQHKISFTNFWNRFSTNNSPKQYSLSMNNDLQPVAIDDVNRSSTSNIAVLAVVYYLSNLNKFDFHLINYCMRVGLSVEDVIILLLLNDIHTIEVFCRSKNIHSQSYMMIVNLKKLSALHKVENNFN